MELHLGLEFDNLVFIPPAAFQSGVVYAGPKRLLQWLENQTGLTGHPENTDYLRIELYRQALLQWIETAAEPPFYGASFEADRFATAAALLNRRDELLRAGWDFTAGAYCPARLATLAALERIFLKKTNNPDIGVAATGFADRCQHALFWLEKRAVPLSRIVLHDPMDLYPPFVRRVIAKFQEKNTPVSCLTAGPAAAAGTDLGWLQRRLLGQSAGKIPAANDGSLLILTARRDSDAAVFMAQWLAKNPGWRPVFLIPELNRILEQAMVQEGLPSMGVLSASLARPSLQVLKLAPAFLWEPVDVFKVMEFLTLPLKPLDDGLALEIARVLAEKPGLFSDTWYAAALGYLESKTAPAIREQYAFWFDRRHYRADGTAPKREALELYAYLYRWALDVFEESKNPTMLVLAEQARRIRDLLETLPEQRLGFLELERIVRTIYEPAPVQLTIPETGHFEYVHHPGAIAAPIHTLVWWNCLFDGAVPAPDHWQQSEREWLLAQGVLLDDPLVTSRRSIWLSQRPILMARERLVLIVPEQADGAEALPSLLISDIETAFDSRNGFTFCLDRPAHRTALESFGTLPAQELLEIRPHARPAPILLIPQPQRLVESEYETPTNLETLFYYPHRWFFRQKMR